MEVIRRVTKLNKKDNVGITKYGACISCSLIEDGEDPDIGEEILERPKAADFPLNIFKAGDIVIYDGKKIAVKRAYIYNSKPYCILENKKQVSESKLINIKTK